MYPAAKMAIPCAQAAEPSARSQPGPQPPILLRPPAAAAVRVIVNDARAAIRALAEEWDDLAADASEPNSYAEHWFVTASLDTLADETPVRLLEVRRCSRLIGVMLVSLETAYGRTRVSFVANWLHSNLFLGTPLVRQGEEQAFWEAVIDTLDEAAWAPNFIHLRAIADGGPVHRALDAAAASRGRDCAIVHGESRALLASNLGARPYYERQVRPKKRKEIRRLRHRLEELGPVTARTFGAGDDLAAWCDDFLALENAGWKGKAGSALACTPEMETFFRRALEGARARGRLHFLRLDLAGRPIAMLINFLAPPGSFSFKTAFDEEFARFSPGVLIQLENLAVLERSDIAWMDSCAVENHPMIDSLWSGRRRIVRVTVRLRGLRRLGVFLVCRALEIGSSTLRHFAGRGIA